MFKRLFVLMLLTVATMSVSTPAHAAPTSINCPARVGTENDFTCTYQAAPYEVVEVYAPRGTSYGVPYTDANGNGYISLSASTTPGRYRICVAKQGTTIYDPMSMWVCDIVEYIQV